jgi:SAM-dependent methyltransferase
MKKSMDLFGQALYDRFKGEIYPFYMEVYGERQEHNLDRYFRPINKLSKVEKMLISMCSGTILDVGCGTGNYIPELEKKGKVIGIDISPKVIDVARETGINNCYVADIFSYDENNKFDTITMFENNLGMGQTIDGTKKLLKKISNLLNKNGQLLIILSGRSKNKDYLETELIPIYKEIKGEKFKWINFNPKYLRKLCSEINLNLKVISGNKYYSFIKITKK